MTGSGGLAAIVLSCVVAIGCSSPFDDAACTLEARSHAIDVARDVPLPFADAGKLKVEACAVRQGQSPTCTTSVATASGDAFTLGGPSEAVSGSLERAADGNTKLLLTVRIGEGQPSTTTELHVRVLDDAGREMARADGAVRWSDDDCHPAPSTTTI